MKHLFALIILLCSFVAIAQFQVGHISTTYYDPQRNDRAIICELYYPAETAGDDVPIASGQFPFVIFGHGFVMTFSAYQNITEALVSEGFVLIYVETEGSFAPLHAEFGLDLAFMADHFFEENSNAVSIFESHLQDRCAIMGHSMGGGATWLAASTSADVDCIVGLAPAETNPSAIDAAANVSIPAMVLSGSSDIVTSPADNHIPIYDNTSSECKVFVNIIDGSHCGYANTFLESGSLCDFGETGFAGLSREEQQAITHDLLLAFFNYHLRDNTAGNSVLLNYDNQQSNTETQIECLVGMDLPHLVDAVIYPNPCEDLIVLQRNMDGVMSYTLGDFMGRMVGNGSLTFSNHRSELDTRYLPAGVYTLRLNAATSVRFIKR